MFSKTDLAIVFAVVIRRAARGSVSSLDTADSTYCGFGDSDRRRGRVDGVQLNAREVMGRENSRPS
jgi:hypothetical protein